MSNTETKGVRVVDTDGGSTEYVGAEFTQFDDDGRLLVVKGGVTIAVFNSHIWHHADNL